MIIQQTENFSIVQPVQQLGSESLQVTPINEKPLPQWQLGEHKESYALLQRITRVRDQYLVYGKQRARSNSFKWEVVPYHETYSFLTCFWQQFLVLWRITFGGFTLSDEARDIEAKKHLEQLQDTAAKVNSVAAASDAFCNPEVIEKQLVLEGVRVRVLYNYAPIGFGGERLHFLIVPKEHRTTFNDLTEDEYVEANTLSTLLYNHFTSTRKIEDVYLFHKTGIDAGQTVPHWHMHMVFSANSSQDFFGKLTVLRNMSFGSKPIPVEELKPLVEQFKSELHEQSFQL